MLVNINRASTATQIDALLSGFLDNNGNILSGGTIETFEAGTNNPTQTYSARDKSASYGVTISVDSLGQKTVYADGLIKLVVKA